MRKQSCSWVPVQTGKSLDACTRVIWSSHPAKPDIEDMVSLSRCRQIRSPDGRPASLSPCKLYFDLDLIQLHAPTAAPSSTATYCSTSMHGRQAGDCERICKSESVGEGEEGKEGGGGGCFPPAYSPSLHHSLKSCTLSSPKSSSCSPPSSASTSDFIPCFFFSDSRTGERRQKASTATGGRDRGVGAGIELHKVSILSAAKNIELYQRGEDVVDCDGDGYESGEGRGGSGSAVSPLAGDEGTCWQNNSHDSDRRSISTTSSFTTAEKEGSDEYVTTGRGELIEDADGEFMFSASVQIDMGKSVRRFRINLIPRQESTTTTLWIYAVLVEIRSSAPPPLSASSLAGEQRFRESLAQNITPSSSSSSLGRMMANPYLPSHSSGATFPDLMLMSSLMLHMRRNMTAGTAEQAGNRVHPQDGETNNKSNRVTGEQKGELDGNLPQAASDVQPFTGSSVLKGQGQYSCGSSSPPSSSSSLPFPFSSYLPSDGLNATAAALVPVTGTMYGCSLLPDIRSPPLSPCTLLPAGRTSANDRLHRPLTDTDTTAPTGSAGDADHQDAALDGLVDHEQETHSDKGTRTGKLSFHQRRQQSSDWHQHSALPPPTRRREGGGRECDTFPFPLPSLGSSVSSVETSVVQSGQRAGMALERCTDAPECKQENQGNHCPPHPDNEYRSHHCPDGDDHLFRLIQDVKQSLQQGFNQVFSRLDQIDDRIERIEGHLQVEREKENQ